LTRLVDVACTSNASDDDDASFFIRGIGEKEADGCAKKFVGFTRWWIRGGGIGRNDEDDSNDGDANDATLRVDVFADGGGGNGERDAAEWTRGRRGGDAGGWGESTTEFAESKSKQSVRGVERESGSRNAAVTAAGTTDDDAGSRVPNTSAERTRRGWDWCGDSRGDRRGVSPDATLGNEVGRRACRSGNVGRGEKVRVSDYYVALHC